MKSPITRMAASMGIGESIGLTVERVLGERNLMANGYDVELTVTIYRNLIRWESQSFFVEAINKDVSLIITHSPEDEFKWNGTIKQEDMEYGFHCYRSQERDLNHAIAYLTQELSKLQQATEPAKNLFALMNKLYK